MSDYDPRLQLARIVDALYLIAAVLAAGVIAYCSKR